MRKIMFLGFLLISFSAVSQNVTLKITGIKEAKGNILIGVYDNAKNFAVVGKEMKMITVPAESKTVTTVIKDLKGEYGFALVHDKNANGQCDYNVLGIPKESFGFSNNVKPKLKAPSFEAVKVRITKDTILNINLISF